jgi:hypothetical protein
LEDSYWNDHQRLKQYAGGHRETWGGVELVIDSNVLDGHITSLPLHTNNTFNDISIFTTTIIQSGSQIDDFSLINQGYGWVLTGGRLLLTADGGQSWQLHSPSNIRVSAAVYTPEGNVWLIGRDEDLGQLQVGHSNIGSRDWSTFPFPEDDYDLEHSIAQSYLEALDSSTAYLVFKLVSSSNFSIGRMFFTQDGGRTWAERVIPIGEPVRFQNPNEGWTAGGATGNEYYRTKDGGVTWLSLSHKDYAEIQGNPNGEKLILPTGSIKTSAFNKFQAWTYVADSSCQGDKGTQQLFCRQTSTLFATNDGGISWRIISPESE